MDLRGSLLNEATISSSGGLTIKNLNMLRIKNEREMPLRIAP